MQFTVDKQLKSENIHFRKTQFSAIKTGDLDFSSSIHKYICYILEHESSYSTLETVLTKNA